MLGGSACIRVQRTHVEHTERSPILISGACMHARREHVEPPRPIVTERERRENTEAMSRRRADTRSRFSSHEYDTRNRIPTLDPHQQSAGDMGHRSGTTSSARNERERTRLRAAPEPRAQPRAPDPARLPGANQKNNTGRTACRCRAAPRIIFYELGKPVETRPTPRVKHAEPRRT